MRTLSAPGGPVTCSFLELPAEKIVSLLGLGFVCVYEHQPMPKGESDA